MPDKPIIDIRLFGAEKTWQPGRAQPADLEASYGISRDQKRRLNHVATRICRKLREKEFSIGGCDHLYISFIKESDQAGGNTQDSQWGGARVVYSYLPLPPTRLSGKEKEDEEIFLELIKVALTSANQQGKEGLIKISDTFDEYGSLGSEIEITLKQKETKNYSITVSYRICPNEAVSVAYLSVYDKESKIARRGKITSLLLWSDIMPLCGTIIANKEEVTIKPMKSFSAEIVTKKYPTPFTLKISELEQLQSG